MRTSDFDYELPEELIAQEPSLVRGADRMLVLDPATSDVTIGMFESLPDYLRPGDAIVLNNTITWAADVRKAKPAIFRKMIRRAMTTDFSWNRTAGNYERMYEDAHQ